jgi:hypothetical protein
MQREAPRTLFSLSSKFQTLPEDAFEVIVIENGSPNPISENAVKYFGKNFRYLYFETDSQSPAKAINFGVSQAHGDFLGICIDGARILTPGILEYANKATKVYSNPMLATWSWHLGPDIQQRSVLDDYSQDAEDELLKKIGWENNPYRLFEISTLAGSGKKGWFAPMAESNCLFLKKSDFEKLNGFDKRFISPGGGLLNLDFFKRASELEGIEPIVLLGEGTFHQLHGGASTSGNIPRYFEKHKAEYERITGHEYELPGFKPDYWGGTPRSAARFFREEFLVFK